jgi:hypothetical protein
VSYERLADLARREEMLVAGDHWDDLILLQGEREETLAALPSTAELTDLPLLELALTRSRSTERALTAELARVTSQLAALGQGRRVAVAYGGEPAARLDARA